MFAELKLKLEPYFIADFHFFVVVVYVILSTRLPEIVTTRRKVKQWYFSGILII